MTECKGIVQNISPILVIRYHRMLGVINVTKNDLHFGCGVFLRVMFFAPMAQILYLSVLYHFRVILLGPLDRRGVAVEADNVGVFPATEFVHDVAF